MQQGDEQPPGLGIYIHWPFCQSKCPYCDFNSHVVQGVDYKRWQRALIGALEHALGQIGPSRVSSIFFGGGTPSLMPTATVGALIDAVAGRCQLSQDAEITLEANPGSVEAERFRGYRSSGVNRLSVGIQSLRDDALQRLGRLHSAAEARAALDVARAHFPRFSFDLIYARQDQTADDWERELTSALEIAGDHLSLYQLTIEPGTRFGDLHAAGRLRGLPGDELALEMYEITQRLCAGAGLGCYEVSNHALPGQESRHNLIYWRGDPYIGIGPGAHGRISRNGYWVATRDLRNPSKWLAEVEARGHGRDTEATLSGLERAEEILIMGLRLTDGFECAKFDRLAGRPLSADTLAELEAGGFLWRQGWRFGTTARGRVVLNAILERLLT